VYSIQHYVIKFVSGLRQVGGFLRVIWFPPPINLTAMHDITETIYGGTARRIASLLQGSARRGVMGINATFNNSFSYIVHGGQVYWWRKPDYPEKPTDLPQTTDKL
jgi:hypothetical protein